MSKPQLAKVLVAGIYNGENHRSLGWCEAGALVHVAGGAYLNSLIEDNFVEPIDERQARALLEAELDALSADLTAAEGKSDEGVDGPGDNTAVEILAKVAPAKSAPAAPKTVKAPRVRG